MLSACAVTRLYTRTIAFSGRYEYGIFEVTRAPGFPFAASCAYRTAFTIFYVIETRLLFAHATAVRYFSGRSRERSCHDLRGVSPPFRTKYRLGLRTFRSVRRNVVVIARSITSLPFVTNTIPWCTIVINRVSGVAGE